MVYFVVSSVRWKKKTGRLSTRKENIDEVKRSKNVPHKNEMILLNIKIKLERKSTQHVSASGIYIHSAFNKKYNLKELLYLLTTSLCLLCLMFIEFSEGVRQTQQVKCFSYFCFVVDEPIACLFSFGAEDSDVSPRELEGCFHQC